MKKIVAFMLIAFLASCGGGEENEGKKEIKEQISEYQKQVDELNEKISQLKSKLKEQGEGTVYKVPVEIKTLQFEEFNHYVEVSGTVEAADNANISPEINGQIEKVYVDEGQRVKKGTPLVKLNTNVIESSISEVETRLELSETLYKRQKELWEKKIGSEVEYLQAKNNYESLKKNLQTLNAQLDMAGIESPIDGVVDEIFQKVGELAIPGMNIMQVVNLSKIYINADVSEAYLTKIKVGDMVDLEFPSYPDIKMDVPVFRVGNVVKPENRTFRVQLRLDNPGNQLKPNVMAIIRINDFSADSALIIPSIIIKEDLKDSYVYVASKENKHYVADKRYIDIGHSYKEETMITDGLHKGDHVIVEGYGQVSDGSRIEIRQ